MEWRAPFGAMSAANWIGLNASQYLHRYGATREMLGWIALNARANAALNPDAIYRDPMTMDDYLSARMITTPFGLYDCDVPCDGAIAVVVSAADTVDDLAQPAIRLDAVGTQITERVSWDQGTLTHEPRSSARRLTCGPVPTSHRAMSTSPCSTTGSPSTPSPGLKGSDSADTARRRTGSTGGVASPSTATFRSTRTAANSPRAAPTDSVSSTRPSPSFAATPAIDRLQTPASRSCRPAAAPRRVPSCYAETDRLTRAALAVL